MIINGWGAIRNEGKGFFKRFIRQTLLLTVLCEMYGLFGVTSDSKVINMKGFELIPTTYTGIICKRLKSKKGPRRMLNSNCPIRIKKEKDKQIVMTINSRPCIPFDTIPLPRVLPFC